MRLKQQVIKENKELIEEMRQELWELEERTRKLELMPDFNEDEELIGIHDFPGSVKILLLYDDGIHTIFDLVYSSPERILRIKGLGKVYLKQVEEWLDKHGLTFVG